MRIRKPHIERGTSTWIANDLSSTPTYGDILFCRRFVLSKKLFDEILEENIQVACPSLWCTLVNAAVKLEIPAQVKLLFCLRVLTSGRIMEDLDYSAGMAEDMVRVYTKRFVKYIISLYGVKFYNTRPTDVELQCV